MAMAKGYGETQNSKYSYSYKSSSKIIFLSSLNFGEIGKTCNLSLVRKLISCQTNQKGSFLPKLDANLAKERPKNFDTRLHIRISHLALERHNPRLDKVEKVRSGQGGLRL